MASRSGGETRGAARGGETRSGAPNASSNTKPARAAKPSRTALVKAVLDLRVADVVAMLQSAPALLAYRDERGRNLLHLCCGVDVAKRKLRPADSILTADVLLDAGLDLNLEAFREGAWRATPLWYAISRGRNLKLAKHLLERGSDPNHCLFAASFHDDLAAIRLLLANGADIESVAEDETPFLGAVKVSHFEPARLLLENGANPDFRDSRGMTALHYMLKKGSEPRHFALLAHHGARGDIPDASGKTASELLARKRDAELRRIAGVLARGRAS